MKICILTDFFPPSKGGFSSYMYGLAKNWLELGAEVTIVSTVIPTEGQAYYEDSIRKNIFFIERKATDYFSIAVVFVRFLRFVFNGKPDIIFFPSWHRYSLVMLIFSYLTLGKYPYIIACHGADVLALHLNSSFPGRLIVKKMGRRALLRAKAVFAVSNYTASELRKIGVLPERIKTFPNGVDFQKFKPIAVDRKALFAKYSIPDVKSLLTVGQLNVRKGIDKAMLVVRELRDHNYVVNYIIIGDGPDEIRLRTLVNEYGLENQVFILKDIDDKELVEFYNTCDIFLLLSRHENDKNVEGFGIVILEASACEKPVIAGNSGGIPDALEDGKSGFLVDPYEVEKIKDKVLFLLDNPEVSREMGTYGRQRLPSNYNWRLIASDMLASMNDLL